MWKTPTKQGHLNQQYALMKTEAASPGLQESAPGPRVYISFTLAFLWNS